MESIIADLLADRAPDRARNLFLAWEEKRSSSWADADREARSKAASGGHLPQMRGQLRYHFGEKALADAAQQAKLGSIPFHTDPPGGVFTLARVGRFGIVSLCLPFSRKLPRRSKTRLILGRPNEEIDPQPGLFEVEKKPDPTQLAFLGCLIAIPAYKDHSAPHALVFGVPTADFDDWIIWAPIHRMHSLLLERSGSKPATASEPSFVTDSVFPTFKIPKEGADDQSG